MLAKKFKLTKADNIRGILSAGKELKSHYFVIKYEETTEPHSRFAIVVSGKISKKAVERNRLRRQIYEIIRLNLEKASLKTPSKIVILPRNKTLKMEYAEIEKILLNTLNANS